VDHLGTLPGVEHAAVVDWLPLSGMGATVDFRVVGRPPVQGAQPSAELRVVSSDYFRALRIPLHSGRWFDNRDQAGSPPVVVVNRALARRYFGNEDPSGQRIILQMREPVACEIAGVVGDVRQNTLRQESAPEVFALNLQPPFVLHSTRDLAVRASGNALALAPAIRTVVREMEPDIPIGEMPLMEEVVSGSLKPLRFYSWALGIFAVSALTLAAFGIYGGVASTVAQRTREIGIRLAFGAGRGHLLRTVALHGALPAFAGLLAGLLPAFFVGRALRTQLYGITPVDTLTLMTVIAVLAFVAVAAAVLPARHATRVDPAVALRSE
jgi:predicted permease